MPRKKTSEVVPDGKKPAKRKVGRPKSDKDTFFTEIQPFLYLGYTLHKSCILAYVPYTTARDWYLENEGDNDFRKRVDRERGKLTAIGRAHVSRAIEQGDRDTIKWWLERNEKDELSTRLELTGADGQPLGGSGEQSLASIAASMKALAEEAEQAEEEVGIVNDEPGIPEGEGEPMGPTGDGQAPSP